MNEPDTPIQTSLRIPGNWSHPGELLERMPADYCLTPEALTLPDGTEIELMLMAPDDQFAQIFRSSCRQPPTDDEMAIVNSYTANIGLTGPGGSKEAALAMMHAGAAIVRAGGAGVFIDNSAVAHGGGQWIEMAEDGGPDALSFAFVAVVRGHHDRLVRFELLAHDFHGFLPKVGVADGHDFVDQQDVRIHLKRHRETEPRRHPRGIGADRLIDEIAQFAELDDRLHSGLDPSRSP